MQAGKVYPIGKVRYDTWKKVFETEVTASTPTSQLLTTFCGQNGATSGNADTGQVQTFAGSAQIVAPENPTFVGTAQLDSTVKKFGRTSLLLDGDSDYLTLPDSDDWYFGTGDFTIDCWVRLPTIPVSSDYDSICGQFVDSNNFWYATIYHDVSGSIVNVVLKDSSTIRLNFYASVTLVAGTWYHIAITRCGNNWYIFQDGVSKTLTKVSGDYSASFVNLSTTLTVGKLSTNYLNGWMDEFRISKGIARWTANFTVPTSPYTADYQTPLLLHFAGTDGGTTTSNSGSRGRVGQSSLLLDGDSDYITIPDSDDWNFGTGAFTIDMWIKPVALLGSDQYIFNHYESNTKRFSVYINADGNVTVYVANTNVIAWYREATPHLVQGAWNHVAIVRSGETAYIFINGTASALSVVTAMGAKDLGLITGPLYFGTYTGTGQFFNGQIDAVRITKGTALWTSDFTPPSTPEDYVGTIATTIFGLQGDIDEEYMLDTEGFSRLKFNGDNAANYGQQRLQGQDTAISAFRNAPTYMSLSTASNNIIHAKKGYVRTAIKSYIEGVSGTEITLVRAVGNCWNNTTDELTSMTLYGLTAVSVGAKISLYKRVKA